MEGEPLLFVDGTILTLDDDHPRAEAVLTTNGRVEAVGSNDDLRSGHPAARQVDLGGRTVIPGFNDSHAHILSFGLDLGRMDVSADRVGSIAEIEQVVAERAGGAEPDEWLLGRGYDQNHLREGRHPSAGELDRASGGRPVVLWHTSGHVLAASRRALQLAGITEDTVTPPGSEIERDEQGRPTGVLKESPAMNLVARVLPPPSVEEGRDAILRAMEVMASQGITSASDAATGRGDDVEPELAMYRGALESGRLQARITLMPQIIYVAPPDSDRVLLPGDFDAGNRPDWLRIGSTKIFSDGALSTRTAAVRRPYQGNGGDGILLWEPDVLAGMMRRAHRSGWHIATHALGDRAIETVLDCYGDVLAEMPRPDHRHRIEHCMMTDEGLAQRIKDLGVLPSLQPDIFRLGDGYITALGPERASEVIPMALFNRLGIRVAFSSDRPVIPGDPLQCILDAMERRTPGGVVLGPQHRIPAMEGIRNYTTGGAFAGHLDGSRGRIRPGMLADFAVLDRDPTGAGPDDIRATNVTMTVLGGEIIFER
jgi:predicted amidohydrolase YtcJ